MLNQFSRTELLLGHDAMEKLAGCRVAVFGIGGVGGYTVEALARSGVGALDLIDDDRVCLTNINRQLLALRTTVGQYKVDVAAERVRAINPNCTVTTHKCFYLPETKDQFDFTQYDYVVDAIDTGSPSSSRRRPPERLSSAPWAQAIRSTPRPSAWPTSMRRPSARWRA